MGELKERFLSVYNNAVHRDGSDVLLRWLEDSDFFVAPASTKFHGCHEGGLLQHSLNVYDCLKRGLANAGLQNSYPEETVAVVSLLHDICKVNFYKKGFRNVKDVLRDLDEKTSINSRQLDILIKLDFFSDFGNQRELLRITSLFSEMFKKGQAKQIRKSDVDGTPLEEIVKRYAVGVTKSGGIAKSYTLLDVASILREAETVIKAAGMDDLSDLIKVRNFYDVMGYIGYVSGNEADRRKLYITDIKPLYRKRDNKQFGYSLFTKSIGSGKESRFTVFNRVFDKEPVKEGDIIYCKGYERDGEYYTLTAYQQVF